MGRLVSICVLSRAVLEIVLPTVLTIAIFDIAGARGGQGKRLPLLSLSEALHQRERFGLTIMLDKTNILKDPWQGKRFRLQVLAAGRLQAVLDKYSP